MCFLVAKAFLTAWFFCCCVFFNSLRFELSSETFLDGTPVPRDLVFGDYNLVTDGARWVLNVYFLEEHVKTRQAIG